MSETRIHSVPTGTMAQALGPIASKLVFDFDLVDRLKNLTSTELRNRVLTRLAFACDAYINIAIQRALTQLKADVELEGAPKWDSYQAFLNWAAGIAASEQLMFEAGMQIEPLRESVQKLFDVRTQIHDILSQSIGASYEVPLITDWMRNPRVRRDDASTMAKLNAAARMYATNDAGVIDLDVEHQMLESIALKRSATKQDQLKWDKLRGELSAQFFDALGIRDDTFDVGYAGEHEEPFLELDIDVQYKLLTGCVRYINDTLMIDLVNDRKVTPEVHCAANIEAKPLVKAIKLACEHRRFDNVQV